MTIEATTPRLENHGIHSWLAEAPRLAVDEHVKLGGTRKMVLWYYNGRKRPWTYVQSGRVDASQHKRERCVSIQAGRWAGYTGTVHVGLSETSAGLNKLGRGFCSVLILAVV
jgi:hypothetical protein